MHPSGASQTEGVHDGPPTEGISHWEPVIKLLEKVKEAMIRPPINQQPEELSTRPRTEGSRKK